MKLPMLDLLNVLFTYMKGTSIYVKNDTGHWAGLIQGVPVLFLVHAYSINQFLGFSFSFGFTTEIMFMSPLEEAAR